MKTKAEPAQNTKGIGARVRVNGNLGEITEINDGIATVKHTHPTVDPSAALITLGFHPLEACEPV